MLIISAYSIHLVFQGYREHFLLSKMCCYLDQEKALQLTCPAYVPNFFLRPAANPARHLAAIETSITLASFPTTWNTVNLSRDNRETQTCEKKMLFEATQEYFEPLPSLGL